MFKRILVPLDFSPRSHEALALARENFPQASLRLLHVLDLKKVGSRPNDHFTSPLHAGELVEAAEKEAHEKLKRLTRPGDEVGVLVGEPAEKILWAVERWKPDLVMMGTHGRTGLAHLLLGSVAEEVVRRSVVPVLVTKEPKPPKP